MIEDILKKHLAKSKCQHPLIGKEWDLVFEAMDEYAQQESRKEAIAFGKWYRSEQWHIEPYKTMDQVFDLYIQSKQK